MNPDELFPPEAITSLSPRLIWLREHNLETVQIDTPADAKSGNIPSWKCQSKDGSAAKHVAYGDTENEAICAFCEVSGVTHWSGIP